VKNQIIFIFLLLTLLTACATPTPSSPLPTPTASPAPTVDISAPEAVGRSYLKAWEQEDYETMYALLLPSLRVGLSQEDFSQAHRNALATTTTISVTLTPQTLGLDQNRAWIDFQESWHTAIFSELKTSNRLNLSYEKNQWWIDWRREAIWPDLSANTNFAVEYQTPPRANIYDRQGAGLAIPGTLVTLGVVPSKIEDETAILTALSQVLEVPPEGIQALYADQPANWFISVGEISGEESLANNDLLNLPGIERRETSGRVYPLDGVASQLVGWISPIPADDLESYRRRGYRDDAWVGIAGLEAWGEPYLAGKNGGRLSLVDANNQYIKGLAESRPERGRSLYTTIDRDLQQKIEQILGARPGAIVALDINTGAILAMASGPGFDNNIFIRATDEWQRLAVLNDPNHPLLNRAIQGLYPTGSVFKIVTFSAGLEAGGMTPETYFYCPGYWDALGYENRKYCWSSSGHGSLSLADALTSSCNVTFYEIGRILDGQEQKILPSYGRAFGLGQPTGLAELPEDPGLMPDPDWKFTTYNEPWTTGDTVNLAIGQGYLMVNPLQVARMVAAVGNGGTLYRPYLVDHISPVNGEPEEKFSPQALSRLPLSADNLAALQQAMLNVTTSPRGTATTVFRGLDILVAGKTGTAQQAGAESLPHSWFAGYFPADKPEIALVVMVESAGEGSSVAAPIFRQVVEACYNREITPLPDPAELPDGD